MSRRTAGLLLVILIATGLPAAAGRIGVEAAGQKSGKVKESRAPEAPPSGLEQLILGPHEPGEPVSELGALAEAAIRLPVATALGALLAFRPRRRGTPPRTPPVIQTQIVLAIVGALVMLVVGSSLARAFGIVGAAGLIRYRAKIEDPKDAAVMLSTLGVGLAAGVGLHLLAGFATLFVLGVLFVVEGLEEGRKYFAVTVKARGAASLRRDVERALARNRVGYELRSSNADDLCYAVDMPLDGSTERVTNAILRLRHEDPVSIEWEERKKK